jgi:uncharacterized membrane protein HdeD (DUF308 family)
MRTLAVGILLFVVGLLSITYLDAFLGAWVVVLGGLLILAGAVLAALHFFGRTGSIARRGGGPT